MSWVDSMDGPASNASQRVTAGIRPAGEGFGRHAGVAVRVPIIHPCWSGGMLVFVKDAAEPVPSVDVHVRDPLRIVDWMR
jgi:hypothetical protein